MGVVVVVLTCWARSAPPAYLPSTTPLLSLYTTPSPHTRPTGRDAVTFGPVVSMCCRNERRRGLGRVGGV